MSENFNYTTSFAEEFESEPVPGRVAILDAGGQYVDMVRKAVERQGIPADVLPMDTPREELEARYAAVIMTGSPASSHHEAAPQPDPTLWESNLPFLGICYGMQAMAIAHGGQVATNVIREDGRVTTSVDTSHPLFTGSKAELTALFTHGDFVTDIPQGFSAIGQHQLSDGSLAYSAIASDNKLGVQFHPEVFDDTPEGYQLFQRFLHDIAGIAADEEFMEQRLEMIIDSKRQAIAEQVGDSHVVAFVSGGVDSSVAATLAAGIINPDKFHSFYIDTGFMRDEDDQVIDFMQAAGVNVVKIDAAERFESTTTEIDGKTIGPLVSTSDPEEKRKLIGKAFIDVQNNLLASLELDEAVLLQGTNAADRIESGHSTGGSHTMVIKSHHNQVREVQELKARGLLIEPLDDLFKDEVRALGRELGLPEDLVERQPFPGPGTAVRIIASGMERAPVPDVALHEAVNDFVSSRYLESGATVQAAVLPVRSVGVGGDERSHMSVVAIENAALGSDILADLAQSVPAHFRNHVNRVVYALGPQPVREWSITDTSLARQSRNQLRHADKIVFDAMRSYGVLSHIKQMPVVLLPLSFGDTGGRSVVLRPVATSAFMTAQAMLPERDLPYEFFDEITNRILSEVPGMTQVFLDLTNKPPGTIEWE